MLRNEKILITGATGKIAFPIARSLAPRNEVWGAARFTKSGDRDKLTAAGIRPLQLDMSSGDLSAVPDDFTYVFHAAVDAGQGDWRRCVRTNAHNSGELLHHCRKAKGFVYCSTGSIYLYQNSSDAVPRSWNVMPCSSHIFAITSSPKRSALSHHSRRVCPSTLMAAATTPSSRKRDRRSRSCWAE